MVIRAIVFLLLYKVCSFLRVLGSSQRPVPVAVLPQSRREYIPVGSMAASMPPKLCATLPPALAKFRASRTLFWGWGVAAGLVFVLLHRWCGGFFSSSQRKCLPKSIVGMEQSMGSMDAAPEPTRTYSRRLCGTTDNAQATFASYFLPSSISTAGSTLPSTNSRKAPPPVEI